MFTVVWQSRYNGIGFYWDESVEESTDLEVLETIGEEISMNLPDYTGEVVDFFGCLPQEEIDELKRRSLTIINKYLPDVKIEEVNYEEDPYSS